MKTLATERQAKITYLQRGLIRLQNNPDWHYLLNYPSHPKVQALLRARAGILAEIKELGKVRALDKTK